MNLGGHATVAIAIFIIIMGAVFLQYSSQVPSSLFSGPANQATSSGTPAVPGPGTYCSAPEAGEVITFQAPKDNATKCPNGPSGSYKSGGDYRNNFGGNTTYKLVRKNVPLNKEFFTKSDGSEHSTKAADEGIQTSLDPTKYELYFPQISGEIKVEGNSPYSRTRDCGDRSYENQGLIYFIDYGMAFGLILKDGRPIEVGGFYLTDVFKDINREEIPQIAYDQCSSPTTASSSPAAISKPDVVIPPQNVSEDNAELQLSYFLFSKGSTPSTAPGPAVSGWIDTCKPAVYLYPPKRMMVNVKVYPEGFLTYTDPVYDLKEGWKVWANPDGKLEMVNDYGFKIYDYLYFESKIRDEVIQKPSEGWVIKSNVNKVTKETEETKEWFVPLEKHFNDILPKLGLNSIQTKDFIDYWRVALPYSPYYSVGIVDQDNVNQFERLEIIPKPDYINRVRIYFERLDQPEQIQAPDLSGFESWNMSSSDSTFKVVEWGGMVKNDPNHPFTCSQ